MIFTVDGDERAPVALNGSGSASVSVTPSAQGAFDVSARYVGDTNFNASTSATLNQTVNLIGTTVAVTSAPNPSALGASVVFTATVTTNSGGGTPTGTVTFSANGTNLGAAVTLNGSGVATLSVSTLAPGTHTITAAYSGDGSNAAGNGTVNHVVQKAPTTTVVTSSVNPSTPGQSVTFTAQVASAIAGTITGNVVFFDGQTTLGQATLDAQGRATFTTTTLPTGTREITATFEGDATYAASTSDTLDQVVGTPSGGDAGVDSGNGDASVGLDSGSQTDGAVIPDLDGGATHDGGLGADPAIEGGGCGCTTVGASDSGALTALGGFFGRALALARRRRK